MQSVFTRDYKGKNRAHNGGIMEVMVAFGEGITADVVRACNGAVGGGGDMVRRVRSSANRAIVSSHQLPINNKPKNRKKRGVLSGWGKGAFRRLSDFLGRVDWVAFLAMGNYCCALNLTFGVMPPSADVCKDILKRYTQALERRGMLGCVRVMEYQKRGVPHFHILSVFKNKISNKDLIDLWCRISSSCGSLPVSQKIVKIYNVKGFAKYQSKHLSKTSINIQRCGYPEQWKESRMKVWAHRGAVPLRDCVVYDNLVKYDFVRDDFHAFMSRFGRRFAVADVCSRMPMFDCNTPHGVRYGMAPFTPLLTRCGIRPPLSIDKYIRYGKVVNCYSIWSRELQRRRRSGRGRLVGDVSRSLWRSFQRTGQLPFTYTGDGLVFDREQRATQHKLRQRQLPVVFDLSQESFLLVKQWFDSRDSDNDYSRGSFSAMDRVAVRYTKQGVLL